MTTEYKPKQLMQLGLDMNELAKEDGDGEPTLAATGSDEGLEGGPGLADEENDDQSETGVREQPFDGRVDDLTESEKFTLQVKNQFDIAEARGHKLLTDSELSLEDRVSQIRENITEIEKHLLIEAIASDEDRSVAGKAMLAALASRLDMSVIRQITGTSPSNLPTRAKDLSDEEFGSLSTQLAAFTARTEEGRKEAERMLNLAMEARASKPRMSVPPPSGEPVDERGPTQAMSITPTPPAPEAKAQAVMIPPAPPAPEPISGAWQSGPEAQPIDQNKIVTQDAPAAEPSVILSPSMEAQMKNEEKKAEPPAQPQLRMLRVGRHEHNDLVISERDVSGKHAELTLLPDNTIKVVDLGSINGTFIDGQRITSEGIASIGQKICFGQYEMLITADGNGQPYLSPTSVTDKPTGHTSAFMAKGEKISEAHRAEQAKLDEEAAKLPPPPKAEEKPKPLKSPTEFERELTGKKSDNKKSSGWRAIGYAALALCLIGCLVGVGVYGGASLLDGMWSDESTVAETETSTETPVETPTEVSETSTPTETPVVETSTPVVAETPSGFSCRPGSSVASCDRAEDFILARADGEAYWDCSSVNPDLFRDFYTREESGHVVVNTCACQLCEPTATP